jgi:aminoglycoside phosphotransferase (APT) family kinase protein
VERVAEWLREHVPESPEATIVHGDFRLGNAMYASGAPARLIAIFDWEMATIGDPLADVGYLCMMWSEAGDPAGGMADLHAVTRAEGFPTRAELVARYEERSGRSMTDIRWYTVLAMWKAVVFMEGNYKRAVAGSTDDPFLKTFGQGVMDLARLAEDVALRGA